MLRTRTSQSRVGLSAKPCNDTGCRSARSTNGFDFDFFIPAHPMVAGSVTIPTLRAPQPNQGCAKNTRLADFSNTLRILNRFGHKPVRSADECVCESVR